MTTPLITARALGDLSPQRALVAAKRIARIEPRIREAAAAAAARLAAMSFDPSTTPSEEE